MVTIVLSVTTSSNRCTNKHPRDTSKTLMWLAVITPAIAGLLVVYSMHHKISTSEVELDQLMTPRSMQEQPSPTSSQFNSSLKWLPIYHLTSTINTTEKQSKIKAVFPITLETMARIIAGWTNGRISGATSIPTCRISPMDLRIRTCQIPTLPM